jgi:hypothetical protein
MSPFSQVEMSPFVIVKQELRHKGDGEVTLLAMSERELSHLENSATGQAQEFEATGGSSAEAKARTGSDVASLAQFRIY